LILEKATNPRTERRGRQTGSRFLGLRGTIPRGGQDTDGRLARRGDPGGRLLWSAGSRDRLEQFVGIAPLVDRGGRVVIRFSTQGFPAGDGRGRSLRTVCGEDGPDLGASTLSKEPWGASGSSERRRAASSGTRVGASRVSGQRVRGPHRNPGPFGVGIEGCFPNGRLVSPGPRSYTDSPRFVIAGAHGQGFCGHRTR